VLIGGEDKKDGPVDVDALTAYLGRVSSAAAPFDPPAGGRITGDGCK
jgi:hypothetical protein